MLCLQTTGSREGARSVLAAYRFSTLSKSVRAAERSSAALSTAALKSLEKAGSRRRVYSSYNIRMRNEELCIRHDMIQARRQN